VFLTYAAPAGRAGGRAGVDRRRVVPAGVVDRRPDAVPGCRDPARGGVRDETESARVMIERVVKADLPFGWVADLDDAFIINICCLRE
jgi:hypothetical protein